MNSWFIQYKQLISVDKRIDASNFARDYLARCDDQYFLFIKTENIALKSLKSLPSVTRFTLSKT